VSSGLDSGSEQLILSFFEQGQVVPEELLEETVAVVDEAAHDLHGGCLFVVDLVELAFIEGEDLRAGVSKQDGRVGGDDELRVFVAAQSVVDEKKERELALWRKRGFRFVEEEEAVAVELALEEGEEGFAVGSQMKALAAIAWEIGGPYPPFSSGSSSLSRCEAVLKKLSARRKKPAPVRLSKERRRARIRASVE
jgi:hypothetical protein